MAKEKSEKKEKKEKKEKRAETNGVHKSSKKDKKTTLVADGAAADKLIADLESREPNIDIQPQTSTNGHAVVDVETGSGEKLQVQVAKPLGALVPFANPLADDKVAKKVYKSVKKAAKAKSLKRGVKEVVKALRKSPASGASGSAGDAPAGVVVIAADISPVDVISHLPVLCEDHGIPYVYVTSRAELGAAGSTKRPTSVVMVGRDRAKAKKDKEGGEGKAEDEEDWGEVYADLVKVVKKAGRDVRI